MRKYAAVILNYNGSNFLRQFLPTLLQHCGSQHVIVADNASTDDSLEVMATNFPDVEIVKMDKNSGYAGGYNEALQHVEAEYYALVNSDIEVTEGWIAPLIEFLDQNATFAAVQPKIKAFSDRDAFEYAGAAGGFIDPLGYAYCRGRVFDTIEKDTGQYDEMIETLWTSGAAMVVRSKLFHEVGGFDIDFFAHMEEIDLCWRLRAAGHQLACLPSSTVYHVGGGTLSATNPRKTYLNFRNNLTLLTKNMPLNELWWKLPVRLVLDILAAFVFWKSNSFAHTRAVFSALFDYLGSSPTTWKKRQGRPLLGLGSGEKSPVVYQYFVAGRKRFSEIQ
ncbi:MAG: glycosyltransferase family 2 protein [Bacteroidota bacterium]